MSEEKDPKDQVVKEIIATAKDDPDVQAAGRNLAKAAKTVTEFINIALLPLSAANWGVERARDYFKGRFESEFKPYISDIPLEDIREPPGEIAGPALQGIAWSLEHEVLKDMFMRLLASAMDTRRKDESHPAFVRVVQELSAQEATLLNKTFNSLSSTPGLPVALLRVATANEPGFEEPVKHLANLVDENHNPARSENFPFWLDNWHRLGIVEVLYDTWLEPEKERYEWVKKRPEYQEVHEGLKENEQIVIVKGVVRFTQFGAKLAAALK